MGFRVWKTERRTRYGQGKEEVGQDTTFNCGACIVDYCFCGTLCILFWINIRVLMGVLNKLVDKGNTVIVIEHNLDVIKMADYIIDMGPEGGKGGGELLSFGTPEEVAKSTKGYTPKFLREELRID